MEEFSMPQSILQIPFGSGTFRTGMQKKKRIFSFFLLTKPGKHL